MPEGEGTDLSEAGEYNCPECAAIVATGACQAIHEAWHNAMEQHMNMLNKQLTQAYVMINKLQKQTPQPWSSGYDPYYKVPPPKRWWQND